MVDLLFRLLGGQHQGVAVGHPALKVGGPQLGVDQTLLEPLQGRLRFEQLAGRGCQTAGILLGLFQQGQELLLRLLRRAGLAEFGADLGDGPPQALSPLVASLRNPQLAQVAAHPSFQIVEPPGRIGQIILGDVDRLLQFMDHALGLLVAELLEAAFELLTDGVGQLDGPLAAGALARR